MWTNIKSKPGVRGANEELEVLPLGVVRGEVRPGGFGSLDTLDTSIRVDIEGASGEEVIDILSGLVDVALDIHGETRSLGNGKTEVESDSTGDAAETDEDTPHVVDVREDSRVILEERGLERLNDDESNERSSCK